MCCRSICLLRWEDGALNIVRSAWISGLICPTKTIADRVDSTRLIKWRKRFGEMLLLLQRRSNFTWFWIYYLQTFLPRHHNSSDAYLYKSYMSHSHRYIHIAYHKHIYIPLFFSPIAHNVRLSINRRLLIKNYSFAWHSDEISILICNKAARLFRYA